ncbi:MAG: LCP family protein [Patescibacteria group bacterium]|nr:LCP family protein [Patescibacteria group bacterium]
MRKKKVLIIVLVITLFVLIKAGLSLSKYTPVLFQLIFNRDITLKKSDHNINLLLLGIGGGKHEGPNLTDTIIFASLDPEKKTVSLVSIPRDLWVSDIDGKINTAYSIGESKKTGGGILLTRALVSKILGQPIDYTIRVDFDGFVKAVDSVGGLDIDVENTFDDYEYPIEGKENDACGHTEEEIQVLATSSSMVDAFPCRYIHVHFDKGLRHMDGDTVLKFVRSRHAKGEEGTDFARNKRQEKVIAAFKNKLFSTDVILNPVKVVSLYSAISDNVDTDIEQTEFDDFVRLAQKMKDAKIQSIVLDTDNEKNQGSGLLINPPIGEEYNNQWVLIPKLGNNDFSGIKNYVACEIKAENCPSINSKKN